MKTLTVIAEGLFLTAAMIYALTDKYEAAIFCIMTALYFSLEGLTIYIVKGGK
jgi:hypothetical protein